jgi:hypothetical protein
MTDTNPPRWAELALQVILKRRDRESIAGDLLEEYREEIVPNRGKPRRHVWYLVQVVSLMSAPQQAVLLGLVFGVWVIFFMTAAPVLPIFIQRRYVVYKSASGNGFGYAVILLLFVGAGYFAWRRTRELVPTIEAGATAALVSVGGLFSIISFVVGVRIGPYGVELLAIAVVLGGFCGLLGGLIAKISTTILRVVR